MWKGINSESVYISVYFDTLMRGDKMTKRINITLPDKLKDELDRYNRDNPYRKINISQVAQRALHEELITVTESTKMTA
jgi:metal-responsive CopG/Arc/MetJ family transcriptional regulator